MSDTADMEAMRERLAAPAGPPGPCDFADGLSVLAFWPPDTVLVYEDMQRLHGGCSRDTITRAVKAGDLPQPGRFMGRAAWTAGDVADWIADRVRRTQRERIEALNT